MEMTEMKQLWVFLVTALVLFGAGCKNNQQKEAHAALCDVFHDFEYAGSVQSLTQVGTIMPGRYTPIPPQFERGNQYVFFHRAPLRNAEMETVAIPNRLRSHGFKFKPISNSDLIYPDAGGPLFTLEFEGRCSGTILNVVHRRIIEEPTLRGSWALEAYVLEIQEAC
jgi:hypothetical protein